MCLEMEWNELTAKLWQQNIYLKQYYIVVQTASFVISQLFDRQILFTSEAEVVFRFWCWQLSFVYYKTYFTVQQRRKYVHRCNTNAEILELYIAKKSESTQIKLETS